MADQTDLDLAKLERLLPEALRQDWRIVPRPLLWQAPLLTLLIGLAFGMSIVGQIHDLPVRYAWPFGLALLGLHRYAPWMRLARHNRQLREFAASSPDQTRAR